MTPTRAGLGSVRSDAKHMAKCGDRTRYYCRMYGKLCNPSCPVAYRKHRKRARSSEGGVVTDEDRKRYPYHTVSAILGKKLIGGLRNVTLRVLCDEYQNTKDDTPHTAAMLVLMGKETNLNWIQGEVVDEMYSRHMIDERQWESLSEECS